MKYKLSFLFLSSLLLFSSSLNANGFIQNSDALGLVVIQAEKYDSLRAGTKGDTWLIQLLLPDLQVLAICKVQMPEFIPQIQRL